MQDISERLGKLVRESRIKRNMTQLELAEVIDKSERTVVKIEKGEGNPKLDSLAQIVKTLKINLCPRSAAADWTRYPPSVISFDAHYITLPNGSSASVRPAFAIFQVNGCVRAICLL